VQIDAELTPQTPPDTLWHGTASRFLESILREGLKPMSRLYVHLSGDADTALDVGARHGKPVVLAVDARRMAEDGCLFYISANGVWLTKTVPPAYLRTEAAR